MLALVLSGGAAAEPSSDVTAKLTRVLSAKDAVPCAQVFSLGEAAAVRDALISLADSDVRPSWVPVRAAHCVVGVAHKDAVALEAVDRWLAPGAPPGFAVVVASELDGFEEAEAVRLGRRLIDRTSADAHLTRWVKPYLASSKHDQVSALLPSE